MNARVDLQPVTPVNLQHYWMPFTDNRRFKAKPRLIASAKDMYFTTVEGKQVLDGLATLWCVNAGHGRPRIVEAIRSQAGELDFASSFALGHPLPFRLAERIAAIAPQGMQQVFFTNSGSEAVDTALKIAVAYHRLRGRARVRASSAASARTTASTSAACRSAAWRRTARPTAAC